MTRGASLAAVLALTAGLVGQADEFDAARARLEAGRTDGAASEELRQLAGAARDAFLRMPPDAPARLARLGDAAEIALAAGDAPRALAWARRAEDLGRPAGAVLLEALYIVEGPAAALEAAYARRSQDGTAVFVGRARSLDRGRLFEVALERARDGHIEPTRWLFDAVASGLARYVQTARAAAESGGNGWQQRLPAIETEAGIAAGNAALIHRLLGDHQRAAELYDAAVRFAPHDAILWSDRGLARVAAGDLDAAVASLARSTAVEGEPGAGPGTTNLAVLATRPATADRSDVDAALAAVAQRGGAEPEPGRALDAAIPVLLRLRPDQALIRRLWIDRILGASRGPRPGR